MWFWRPTIYFLGTVELAFFGAPGAEAEIGVGLNIENAPTITSLTRSQFGALKNLAVKMGDQLNDAHLEALTRELSGNHIPNGAGEVFKHYIEVTEAVNGAKADISSLEGSLRNPNLTPAQREVITKVVGQARSVVTRVENIIKSH